MYTIMSYSFIFNIDLMCVSIKYLCKLWFLQLICRMILFILVNHIDERSGIKCSSTQFQELPARLGHTDNISSKKCWAILGNIFNFKESALLVGLHMYRYTVFIVYLPTTVNNIRT